MEESSHQNHSITFSNSTTSAFLRKIKEHAPTLLISGSILLLLTGLIVTATVLCIIFFSPLILFTSPIWFPIGAFLFVVTAGFMSLCGFGGAVVAGLSWIYRYFRGMHPPGPDQFGNGRSWIYDTASHVKDHATQYGGYLQSKEKLDSAPAAPEARRAQQIWEAVVKA
ncbi:oleosin G [Quercus suber]|uniref:oleosin G n=1 Tax=Quercus suber TaxID=58331 RepID=UPI0032E00983